MGDGFNDSDTHHQDVQETIRENQPRVQHIRDKKRKGHRTVYVGRPTRWGNPFKMRTEADRDHVIEMFSQWLDGYPSRIAEVGKRSPSHYEIQRDLRGADLVCHCAPKRCHADVLLKIANS